MSWTARLASAACPTCNHVEHLFEEDYTHNTNEMLRMALIECEEAPGLYPPIAVVVGKADSGVEVLSALVSAMVSDPALYRAQDPPNGWGDYDGLLAILRRMLEAAKKAGPGGTWTVSG